MNQERFLQHSLQIFAWLTAEYRGNELTEAYVRYITAIELPFGKLQIHWIPKPYDGSSIKIIDSENEVVLAQLALRDAEMCLEVQQNNRFKEEPGWTIFITRVAEIIWNGQLDELPKAIHIREYAGLLAQLMIAKPIAL